MKMPKTNVLVAYPYLNKSFAKLITANQKDLTVLIDSGAFTAWKSGKQIKLDDYCRFLETLPFKPWKYFVLDVIGDPIATEKNYQTMLRRGFDPLPIFTRGEHSDAIERFYNQTDMIAIGGLVGTRKNKAFINNIMQQIGNRKVHLLGFCNQDYVTAYKPTSVDSSSWCAGQQFGAMSIYLGNFKTAKYTSREASKRPPAPAVCRALRQHYDLDFRKLKDKEEWRNRGRKATMVTVVAARQILWYQKDIGELGTKYFCACCGGTQVEWLLKAKRFWEAKQ